MIKHLSLTTSVLRLKLEKVNLKTRLKLQINYFSYLIFSKLHNLVPCRFIIVNKVVYLN